jgi:hypothetical protein
MAMTFWGLAVLVAAASVWVVRPRTVGAEADPLDAPTVDPLLVVALLDAAVSTGIDLPRAISVVGRAAGGTTGTDLVAVGARLRLGSSWPEAVEGTSADARSVAAPLADAWTSGAPPSGLLAHDFERRIGARRAYAATAAARLGARLVLPLTVCLLPAFVLLGIVPVVSSLARAAVG